MKCWCGIATTPETPCIFHGGNLQERVDLIMREVRVTDTLDGADLDKGKKWLAFATFVSLRQWLPWTRETQLPPDGFAGKVLGDLIVMATPVWCDSYPNISITERAALAAEAIMGRWPW